MKKIALAFAGMLALGAGVAAAPTPAAATWGYGYGHAGGYYGGPVRVVHRKVVYRNAYYHPRPVVTRVVYRPARRVVYHRPIVRPVVYGGFYQPRPFVSRVVYRDGFRRAHWRGGHWGGGHRWGGHWR